MGGRGAGDATGGANLKLPKLSGSEKQVSWAENIRRTALTNAGLIVEDASKSTGLFGGGAGVRISVKSAKVAQNEIVEVFKNVTSASRIIDNRASLSYDSILKIAAREEMSGEVSAAQKARKSGRR